MLTSFDLCVDRRVIAAARRLPETQNRQRNHPRHREMATSPSKEVKAPQHLKTPRSHVFFAWARVSIKLVSSSMLPLLSASNFRIELSMSKSCLFIAADWTTSSLFFSANSGISSSTCGASKVQVGLQSGVFRGRSEVWLAPVGRLYQRDVVSEFGPLRGPRRRDRETRPPSRGEQRGSRRWRRTTRSDTHPSEDKRTQAADVAVAQSDESPSALREDGLR